MDDVASTADSALPGERGGPFFAAVSAIPTPR